jgi:capsular polysaccharide biosynthesis protein
MSSVLRLVRMVSFAVLVAVAVTLAVSVVVLAWMVLTPTYNASVVVRADSEGETRAVMDVIST